MYHLKLVKAFSYHGIVTATRKEPDVFVEDRTTANAVVATGYFKLVDEKDAQDGGRKGMTGDSGANRLGNGNNEEPEKKLEEMTIPELEVFAADQGIGIKGIAKKADIIARIKAVLGGEEPENEVDYGNSTMIGLQGQ